MGRKVLSRKKQKENKMLVENGLTPHFTDEGTGRRGDRKRPQSHFMVEETCSQKCSVICPGALC